MVCNWFCVVLLIGSCGRGSLGYGCTRLGVGVGTCATFVICFAEWVYICYDWAGGKLFLTLQVVLIHFCSQITINLLAQIIPGTLLPGQPFANMVFKAYAVQTLNAATMFVQDLKLGHYIKVSPRATFLVQVVGTVFAAFVQVGIKQWIFANVPNVCRPDQEFNLTCPYNQVFFTASAIW